MNAWVESADGARVVIEGNCYFGRSHVNNVQLRSTGASRRHALIHSQTTDAIIEYWLADLGSTNGTLCNTRRVVLPCRLRNGDAITIGDESFVFHCPEKVAASSQSPFCTTDTIETVKVRVRMKCWLLMLDIKQFTLLSRSVDPDTLGQKVGQWFRRSREIIERDGGVVDKLLGDAVFAYWSDSPDRASHVLTALAALRELQKARDPDFRIILHRGEAALDGGAGGADNVSGPDMIQVFRMEKVCARLGEDTLLSASAAANLAGQTNCQSRGRHPLDGFPQPVELFGM